MIINFFDLFLSDYLPFIYSVIKNLFLVSKRYFRMNGNNGFVLSCYFDYDVFAGTAI